MRDGELNLQEMENWTFDLKVSITLIELDSFWLFNMTAYENTTKLVDYQ